MRPLLLAALLPLACGQPVTVVLTLHTPVTLNLLNNAHGLARAEPEQGAAHLRDEDGEDTPGSEALDAVIGLSNQQLLMECARRHQRAVEGQLPEGVPEGSPTGFDLERCARL